MRYPKVKLDANGEVEAPQKVYFCHHRDCMRPFSTKFNLRRHILLKHTDKKMYRCHICSQRFALKQYLMEHLEVHKTQKRFVCEYSDCMKQFKTLELLEQHKKLHESQDSAPGEKIFKIHCNYYKKNKFFSSEKVKDSETSFSASLPVFQIQKAPEEDLLLDFMKSISIPKVLCEGVLPLPKAIAKEVKPAAVEKYLGRSVLKREYLKKVQQADLYVLGLKRKGETSNASS